MENVPESEIFKILLATDTHLGYGESIPNRENDTFVTFEEILNIANKENVDFILLGGDLFHEARPSPYCINKCIELIKKYCLGDKGVEIEILSDPSLTFHRNASVNYEDPNMNISIPIFSIHGNHDDPTGKRQISALDLIASTGLINYFGRWDDVTGVEVNPVLLRKGESHLALFGLSHIRDERLARLFIDKKVKMKIPENINDWFNLLVLHQNRAKNRGVKNFIPETCIPDFINLVMWGHEHDCQIEPTALLDGNTFVTQPGSSVATSLSEGEAGRKKVGLLRIYKQHFNITPIELKTVRPFIFKTITLEPPPVVVGRVPIPERAKQHIKEEIGEMLNEAKEYGRTSDMLPLIRLIVYYHDERQIFNAIRFGQEFAEKVANPEDILKFSAVNKKTRSKNTLLDMDLDGDAADDENITRVEDLISKYIDEKNPLKVLSLAGLNAAVKKCIDADDSTAPSFILNNQEKFLLDKLIELQPNEDEIDRCLSRVRSAQNEEEFENLLNNPNRPRVVNNDDDVMILDDSDNESTSKESPVRPAKGPGSRGGRGSRGGKGSRGGRGRAK